MENADNDSSSSDSKSDDYTDGVTFNVSEFVARNSSRRASLEYLPSNFLMEPVPSLLSKPPNPEGHRSAWVPEDTPLNWFHQDVTSGRQAFEQEWWPFYSSNPSKPSKPSKRATKFPASEWTSTFESAFADGGLSIRVQHNPLDLSATEEEEDSGSCSDASQDLTTEDPIVVSPESCEETAERTNVIDSSSTVGFAHMPSQSKSVEVVEPAEVSFPQIEGTSAISSQVLGIERLELPDFEGLPRVGSAKFGEEAFADPAKLTSSSSSSLSSPVKQSMQALADPPESTHSWIQPRLARSDAQNEAPVLEERDLRHSISKGGELAQKDLSFRLWECEETSQDDYDRDYFVDASARDGFPNTDGGGGDQFPGRQSPPSDVDALVNLRAMNLQSTITGAAMVIPSGEVDVESEWGFQSPPPFTRGFSPTSLFSDDQEPFRLSLPCSSDDDDDVFPAFQPIRSRGNSREEFRSGFRKSPRSVLSQKLGEISHETSDSSEMSGKKRPQKPPVKLQQQEQTSPRFKYLYNDESSDLESPTHAKLRRQWQQPFAAFTYSAGKDMSATSASSSEADEGERGAAGSFQDLGLLLEDSDWEPWLIGEGGVLCESKDLGFLLSSDFKCGGDAGEVDSVLEETTPFRTRKLRDEFPSLLESTIEDTAELTVGRTNHGSPRTKPDSPEPTDDSSQSKHDSPKIRRDNRNIEPDSPQSKQDSPKTKPDSPKTQQDSPKEDNDDNPNWIQFDSRKTKIDDPTTQQNSPNMNEHGSRNIENHGSPKTTGDRPKTQHDIQKTKPESPKLRQDSWRGPTSGTEWVPYVTSSLHGNNSTRVRSSTRGGLQLRNPNLEETTCQGKQSVTKPCADKTPRRTVNFAPDLVKNISQTKSPATATPVSSQDRKQSPLRPSPMSKKGATGMGPSKVKSKAWEVEEEAATTTTTTTAAAAAAEAAAGGGGEEDGPSIMNSRRRWRRNRDGGGGKEDAHSAKSSSSRWGSVSWSFSESRFFRNRERVMPSCVGRIALWPSRIAVKVKNSRFVDTDDDDDGYGAGNGEKSFVGDRSFGNSSRRDAELVRRILKGSRKKQSNWTVDDIPKQEVG